MKCSISGRNLVCALNINLSGPIELCLFESWCGFSLSDGLNFLFQVSTFLAHLMIQLDNKIMGENLLPEDEIVQFELMKKVHGSRLWNQFLLRKLILVEATLVLVLQFRIEKFANCSL